MRQLWAAAARITGHSPRGRAPRAVRGYPRHGLAPRRATGWRWAGNSRCGAVHVLLRYLLDLTNAARTAAGLIPVGWDAPAAQVAQAHAADLAAAGYFSHWNREGWGPAHRYSRAGGLHSVMENIYMTRRSFTGGQPAPVLVDQAAIRGVSDSTATRMLARVRPVLDGGGRPPWPRSAPAPPRGRPTAALGGDGPEGAVMVDRVAHAGPRPQERTDADTGYSGKKTQHTLKTQLTVPRGGGVSCALRERGRGPRADVTLLKGGHVAEGLPAGLGRAGAPA